MNARVTRINYFQGAKYFEIEFTHFFLCFDFYGVGNIVLLAKPPLNKSISESITMEAVDDIIKELIFTEGENYQDYDNQERKLSQVLISWYPGIKSGTLFEKNYENVPLLSHKPTGSGYLKNGKLFTYPIENATNYADFGEAVFNLMDKNRVIRVMDEKGNIT